MAASQAASTFAMPGTDKEVLSSEAVGVGLQSGNDFLDFTCHLHRHSAA